MDYIEKAEADAREQITYTVYPDTKTTCLFALILVKLIVDTLVFMTNRLCEGMREIVQEIRNNKS